MLDESTRHREYADAVWALPSDVVDSLEHTAQRLAPRRVLLAVTRLFASIRPELGDPSHRGDYAAYDAALLEQRADAVGRVIGEEGLDGVAGLAAGSEQSWAVGSALAAHTSSYDPQMLGWLAQDRPYREAGHAYFVRRLRDAGAGLLDDLLGATTDAAQRATLLHATRDPAVAWERLPRLDDAVAQEYWRTFAPYGLGHGVDGAERAATGLLSVGRHAASLQLISLYSERGTEELAVVAAQACEGLVNASGADPDQPMLSTHDIARVLTLLHRHRDTLGTTRLVAIEWQLFPLLGFEPDAPTLHETLATDPAFFVELIEHVYRPDTSEEDQQDDRDDARILIARRAGEVLQSSRRCPGTRRDGGIDGDALQEWVSTARTLLAERDRARSGDVEIGQALAYATSEVDGCPPPAVRNVLEAARSDCLDDGLEMGLFNRRGATSRGVHEGGGQERVLATTYRSAASEAVAWPRTRRLLHRLADAYERDARREDDAAEQRRLGLS